MFSMKLFTKAAGCCLGRLRVTSAILLHDRLALMPKLKRETEVPEGREKNYQTYILGKKDNEKLT